MEDDSLEPGEGFYLDPAQTPSHRGDNSIVGAGPTMPDPNIDFDLFNIQEDVDSGAMHLDTQDVPDNERQHRFSWDADPLTQQYNSPVVATGTQVPAPAPGDFLYQSTLGKSIYMPTASANL